LKDCFQWSLVARVFALKIVSACEGMVTLIGVVIVISSLVVVVVVVVVFSPIMTRYGLDGTGIESRWEQDFFPHV